MRIVILHPSLLGDVIVSTPLMRHLRNSIPNLRLTVVLSRKNQAVLPLLGDLVDDVLHYRKRPLALLKLLVRGRLARFDWLIDGCWDPIRASPLLVHMIGPKRSIGLPNGHKNLYDVVVSGPPRGALNFVDRYFLLAEPIGLPPPTDPHIELTLPAAAAEWAQQKQNWPLEPGRKTLLINVSGTGPIKFWGVERFVPFIRATRAAHPELQFAVVGHARDQAAIDQIASEANAARPPTTSDFVHFAALVQRSDYVFTPDTSVVHLAAAWKRPTVALYVQRPLGDTWEPYRTPNVMLQSPTGTVTDIPLEAGIEAFERLLAQVTPPPTLPHTVSESRAGR
jgi:ADP-heptose:LPS heptosyltransferase